MNLRTIGLLGGMTYHSTVDYYMGINDAIAARLGGHASAPLLMSSLNFQDIRDLQLAGDWTGAGQLLAAHAQKLEAAGAEAVVICTNLMHKVAPDVEASIKVPLIHIVDAVADEAANRGLTRLGLMGAEWTMRDPFYERRLADDGIAWVPASEDDIQLTDQIVFDELTRGVILDTSRIKLLGVVNDLAQRGAQGVILGCTEIPLIVNQSHTDVPLIDSAQAHIRAVVKFMTS